MSQVTFVPRFTHLTFDCYGTLIDWKSGIDLHLGGLLRRNGLRPGVNVHPTYVKLEAEHEGNYKPYSMVLHDTAISVAKSFNLSISDSEANEFAATIQYWKPFEDTVSSLRELGERGYKRVILSNVERNLLERTIAQNNLEVDGYVTAEDVGSYKPALGHWNRFFDQYKVGKERTLHVAQSIYHDIVPTTKIGLANAWINRYREEKPTEVNPTWILPDLTGLLRILD
jgi:2-haloalkanoic acid dehalogenase type II